MNALTVLHDALMGGASFLLALWLRLGGRMFYNLDGYLLPYLLCFMAVVVTVQLQARSYRRLWRYSSLNDLLELARSGTLAIALFYGVLFVATRMEAIPRSLLPIHWMTLMLCLMAGRVLCRALFDRTAFRRLLGQRTHQVPVLLIGAGSQAEMFIRESQRSADFPYRAVGLVDDDARHRGREIHGVRIYGGLHELGYVLGKLEGKGRAPQRLLLTDPAMGREQFDGLMELAGKHQLTLARLPSLSELQSGQQMHQIQPVAVEDILGRKSAVLDRAAMEAFVRGKRVLVTGAGGSIGSELVRQVAGYQPAELLLYELSEFALYQIDRELGQRFPELKRRAVIGNVRDPVQLERYFADFKPELVLHAAALKHVPMAESNPEQAVLTNVLGSKRVADACVAHGVPVMLQISTDKAVNPTSVMGATKRVAEIYGQALAQGGEGTRVITVRFGNVLNSAGSVVPLFQEQIARGGPVTVTHPEMQRYFMTIAEAVQLILQAAVIGAELPERAPIFVLDMGQPIRIEELACQMIRLAGLRPYEDIKVTFTGLRPGEKLFEELFLDDENLLATRHKSIRLARARTHDAASVNAALNLLVEAAREGRVKQLPLLIKQLVEEYQLPETKAESA